MTRGVSSALSTPLMANRAVCSTTWPQPQMSSPRLCAAKERRNAKLSRADWCVGHLVARLRKDEHAFMVGISYYALSRFSPPIP